MRLSSFDVLACPHCKGPLERSDGQDAIDRSDLICREEGIRFRVDEGVPELIRPDRLQDVDRFASNLATAWAADGWGGMSSEGLLALPYSRGTRRQRSKWRQKARSLEAVLPLFRGLAPRTVMDVGAGVGWLSLHLARLGHRVFALDILVDPPLGLRTGAVYLQRASFERVRGEMSDLPFRNETADFVVYNASLHYAPATGRALQEAVRVLRPSGTLVVMNSPTHRDGRSARRAEADFRSRLRGLGADPEVASSYNHFVVDELDALLRGEVGATREIRYDPGLAFRAIRRMKALALRMELASFPIILAEKEPRSPSTPLQPGGAR